MVNITLPHLAHQALNHPRRRRGSARLANDRYFTCAYWRGGKAVAISLRRQVVLHRIGRGGVDLHSGPGAEPFNGEQDTRAGWLRGTALPHCYPGWRLVANALVNPLHAVPITEGMPAVCAEQRSLSRQPAHLRPLRDFSISRWQNLHQAVRQPASALAQPFLVTTQVVEDRGCRRCLATLDD